jgi:hypothetical protein
MLALKDHQLTTVMAAASKLPSKKRATFLERIAARLRLSDFRFSDADLEDAVHQALTGLRHASGE